MTFMLDTNIVIHLRDGDAGVAAALGRLAEPVLLSIVTRVELEGGVYREPDQAAPRRARLAVILASLPVVPFDDAAADAYRDIIAAVGYSRRKMLDRMIAAQAIVHRATLITRNAEDFQDIPALRLEVW